MLYLSFLFSLQKKKKEGKEIVPFLLYLLTRTREEYTADAYILLHMKEIQAGFRERVHKKRTALKSRSCLMK